jgi:hypothetical protein
MTYRRKLALLVSLTGLDDGFRISLDDVVEAELSQWSVADHVTSKEVPNRAIVEMDLPEGEAEDLGQSLSARRSAFNEMGEI